MKAVVYTKFGSPEVLRLEDVETPTPKDNEVLIRIHAVSVAKEDPSMRRSPGLNGIFKPKRPVLGQYFAGEVEAVGAQVTRFKVDDHVFGDTGMSLGTYAEYICMPDDGALAIKPKNMSFEEAATVPDGALTALPFLRNKGEIRSGQRVLINGASGAVGVAAVQLAKYFGARVTGVCSTTNVDLVKSLGADEVIDYTNADFTRQDKTYDIVFDAVGKSSFSRCKNILAEQGFYLTTVPTPATLFRILWTSMFGGKKVRFMAAGLMKPEKKTADLITLREIIEAGKFRAVIDKRYPLEEIAEAHRYVETGRKKGNVVVVVADEGLL